MEVALLSGGMDSALLAAWRRPERCLFVDYGQAPAKGEELAARSVAQQLGLTLDSIRVDCSAVGAGLLAGAATLVDAPSPEWWPFRNQLLVTLAAAWALRQGLRQVTVASVSSDGQRHVDARAEFFNKLDEVVRLQEGGLRVLAPAVELTTVELAKRSGVGMEVLGWTHSCHVADHSCGHCPGCTKRLCVLEALGVAR